MGTYSARLKIKETDYVFIEKEINTFLEKNPNIVDDYEKGNFVRSWDVKDLNVRFCWDCFWSIGVSSNFLEDLFDYCNSDHVYSALKYICPTLTRNY